jgi:hypothetical protein
MLKLINPTKEETLEGRSPVLFWGTREFFLKKPASFLERIRHLRKRATCMRALSLQCRINPSTRFATYATFIRRFARSVIAPPIFLLERITYATVNRVQAKRRWQR